MRTTVHRTSRGPLLLMGFAAGAAVGWLGRAHTDSRHPDSRHTGSRTGTTADWAGPARTDALAEQDDAPSPRYHRTPAAPNVDDQLDPELAGDQGLPGSHGTSVADQPWAGDPIRHGM